MIRPQKYNKRIIAHPDSEAAYDVAICEFVKKMLIKTMKSVEVCNITAIAKRLGINRDRVSATIKTLELGDEYKEIQALKTPGKK